MRLIERVNTMKSLNIPNSSDYLLLLGNIPAEALSADSAKNPSWACTGSCDCPCICSCDCPCSISPENSENIDSFWDTI